MDLAEGQRLFLLMDDGAVRLGPSEEIWFWAETDDDIPNQGTAAD